MCYYKTDWNWTCKTDWSCDFGHFWGFYSFWNFDSNCFTQCEPESVIHVSCPESGVPASELPKEGHTLTLIGDDISAEAAEWGLVITHTSENGGLTEAWDSGEYRIIQVNNNDAEVNICHFIDVSVNNYNKCGTDINIYLASKGDIETGCGRDKIDISVEKDGETGFTISSGGGRDAITLTGDGTVLDINAGWGNDVVDISGLGSSCGIIDGGCGRDTLVLGQHTDTVAFKNFEAVVGAECSNASLVLGQEILDSNGSYRFGMVFSDIELSFECNDVIIKEDCLSWYEACYVEKLGFNSEEFDAYTVKFGDDCYNIITDDDLSGACGCA